MKCFDEVAGHGLGIAQFLQKKVEWLLKEMCGE